MSVRRGVWGILISAAFLAFSFGGTAIAQEPILEFRVTPQPASVQSGGSVIVQIAIENPSVREADDIAVAWLEPQPATFSFIRDPEAIKLLGPFESGGIPLEIAPTIGTPLGEHAERLEVLYAYCIGDLCFQIAEEIEVSLLVEPATVADPGNDVQTSSVAPPTSVIPPPPSLPLGWILFAGSVLGVAVLLALGRRDRRRWAAAGLTLLAAGALAYGIVDNQHEQAKSIGSVLCISCVGLEEARPASEVVLSDRAATALQTLDEDVHFTVFSAEWCHSCPFAKRTVELMADATDRLTFEIVDVDLYPDRAVEAGIIESGRTIVPAIIRSGSEEVLFGIERLEPRLLELLELPKERAP